MLGLSRRILPTRRAQRGLQNSSDAAEGFASPHTSFPHEKLQLRSPAPRRERWFVSDGNNEYIMKSFNSSH